MPRTARPEMFVFNKKQNVRRQLLNTCPVPICEYNRLFSSVVL